MASRALWPTCKIYLCKILSTKNFALYSNTERPIKSWKCVKLEESPIVCKVNSLINSTKLPYLHVVKHLPLIHKYLLLNTGLGITAKYPLLPSTLAWGSEWGMCSHNVSCTYERQLVLWRECIFVTWLGKTSIEGQGRPENDSSIGIHS